MSETLHELTMSVPMTPDMANVLGTVHGGVLLKWLDQVAAACASHFSSSFVVTVSVDQVHFKEPIYVGELVTFLASVNYVGRTSMEIGIKVIADNLMTKKRRHTNSCYFTMVCVDENRRPRPAPALHIETEEQKRRFKSGELRKKLRLEYLEKLKSI